jgi:hypothetical protein
MHQLSQKAPNVTTSGSMTCCKHTPPHRPCTLC